MKCGESGPPTTSQSLRRGPGSGCAYRLPKHLLPSKGDAPPRPAGVLSTPGRSPLPAQAPRRRRYTLTPARLRWDHFNLTYRCDPGLGGAGQPGRHP